MADNPFPKPQRDDEPPTDPSKTGYDVVGQDAPLAPLRNDEPPTDPSKTGYDVEGED